MANKQLFGELETGTIDDPALVIQSKHHFLKLVGGKPNKRPAWFFDTNQEGEGIVDVTTHYIDLAMWLCFAEQIIDYKEDIELKKAKRWPSLITAEQFEKVTGLNDFPKYLISRVNEQGEYQCYSNGEIIYTIRGIHAKAAVEWFYQAPEGTGDSQFVMIKGTKAYISLQQGKEQDFKQQIYIEPSAQSNHQDLSAEAEKTIEQLQGQYPGLSLEQAADRWKVIVPDECKVGHENHFKLVMEKFLKFVESGKLPCWEIPNMKTKYRLTAEALKLAER